ncbi:MAG: hypothetical protein HGB21_01475 [Nitrospirae bacterium]|nr:hypothetical protein [Nitrospirota bacterium]
MNKDEYGYFDGFKWAMPKAFKEALAACRFEQGDTLYDTRKAYDGSWKDASSKLQYSIQVELPVRGLKTRFKSLDVVPIDGVGTSQTIDDIGKRNEDLIFADNWKSNVVLKLSTHPNLSYETIKTTQGHLYMMLWKGNIAYLEQSAWKISMPRLAGDARKEIPTTEQVLIGKYASNKRQAQLFVMPIDETRDVLWTKYQRVKETIDKHYDCRQLILMPEEINLPHAAEYVPTLRFAVFVFENVGINTFFNHLKEVLYTPSKNRKTDVDRFKLEMHGYLFPNR